MGGAELQPGPRRVRESSGVTAAAGARLGLEHRNSRPIRTEDSGGKQQGKGRAGGARTSDEKAREKVKAQQRCRGESKQGEERKNEWSGEHRAVKASRGGGGRR